MDVSINNATKVVADYITITEMLAFLGIISSGIAIAINNNVVPKTIWNSHILQHNDQVTIIRATQGG